MLPIISSMSRELPVRFLTITPEKQTFLLGSLVRAVHSELDTIRRGNHL